MKQFRSGIVVVGVILAMVVILGASQDSRTASREVVFGAFTCNALANTEFDTSLSWEGTVGIFGEPGGMGLELATLTEADFATSCQVLAEEISGLAVASGCTLGKVRAIGNTRDFDMVCSGNRDEVVTIMSDLSGRLAESLP
jgi:hypothetical protein